MEFNVQFPPPGFDLLSECSVHPHPQVSSNYDIAMEFNSQGMARGAADSDGRREVAIFKGE